MFDLSDQRFEKQHKRQNHEELIQLKENQHEELKKIEIELFLPREKHCAPQNIPKQ